MSKTTLNPVSVFNSTQYGFSQAAIATGSRHLFLSGQVGIDNNEQLVSPSLYEQTIKSLENIQNIIAQAGGTMDDIVMLRVYIKHTAAGTEDQLKISEALKQFFPLNPPPSSWIIVYGLSLPEWLIEIEAEAILD